MASKPKPATGPAEFEVLVTDGAQRDLAAISDYIAGADGAARSEHVLDRMLEALQSLSRYPERGSYPKELLALGIKEYRQTMVFKTYRLIYRVIGSQVIVYLVADGRRDMQALLARRLLGA